MHRPVIKVKCVVCNKWLMTARDREHVIDVEVKCRGCGRMLDIHSAELVTVIDNE